MNLSSTQISQILILFLSLSLAQDAQKHTPQLSVSLVILFIFFFSTPLIKPRLQIGGRLLMAKHLDQSLWWLNQKLGATVKSYILIQ
jgi:hypothetical protein